MHGRRVLAAPIAASLIIGLSALLAATQPPVAAHPAAAHHDGSQERNFKPPNIVFVLTDDLSTDLLQWLPAAQDLKRDGTSFSRYITSSSLCCPARASILTGQLPHNSGVLLNVGRDGGEPAFIRNGDEQRVFARTLRSAGYRTALI